MESATPQPISFSNHLDRFYFVQIYIFRTVYDTLLILKTQSTATDTLIRSPMSFSLNNVTMQKQTRQRFYYICISPYASPIRTQHSTESQTNLKSKGKLHNPKAKFQKRKRKCQPRNVHNESDASKPTQSKPQTRHRLKKAMRRCKKHSQGLTLQRFDFVI